MEIGACKRKAEHETVIDELMILKFRSAVPGTVLAAAQERLWLPAGKLGTRPVVLTSMESASFTPALSVSSNLRLVPPTSSAGVPTGTLRIRASLPCTVMPLSATKSLASTLHVAAQCHAEPVLGIRTTAVASWSSAVEVIKSRPAVDPLTPDCGGS